VAGRSEADESVPQLALCPLAFGADDMLAACTCLPSRVANASVIRRLPAPVAARSNYVDTWAECRRLVPTPEPRTRHE